MHPNAVSCLSPEKGEMLRHLVGNGPIIVHTVILGSFGLYFALLWSEIKMFVTQNSDSIILDLMWIIRLKYNIIFIHIYSVEKSSSILFALQSRWIQVKRIFFRGIFQITNKQDAVCWDISCSRSCSMLRYFLLPFLQYVEIFPAPVPAVCWDICCSRSCSMLRYFLLPFYGSSAVLEIVVTSYTGNSYKICIMMLTKLIKTGCTANNKCYIITKNNNTNYNMHYCWKL